MISKFYTRDYEGEMLSENISWKQGKKSNNQIWVPKTIVQDESDVGVAHVIGNGRSRKKFDLRLLHGQHGGANGAESVGQSYGCNSLYTEFDPTFLICMHVDLCRNLEKTDYCEENIVYSNPKNISRYPGMFHLYPQIPSGFFAGPLALNLACADGHTDVYMLGFDFYEVNDTHIYPKSTNAYGPLPESVTTLNSKIENQLTEIMTVYDDVNFFRVVQHKGLEIPENWKWLKNYNQIGYGEYVSLAQLGATAK
jgi:hypothetical protein